LLCADPLQLFERRQGRADEPRLAAMLLERLDQLAAPQQRLAQNFVDCFGLLK
jgi:hypothetical protein